MDPVRLRPAVFLDRDNTLIHDPGYLRDPGQVRLMNGAAESLARLRAAGFLLVVVSNQSGVARGYLAEEDVVAVNERMIRLLADANSGVDRIYYCPYLDGAEAIVERYRRDSDLRKPRPGMLLLAAKELGIDLARSWMIGDSQRDADAGRAAGCRSILVSRAPVEPSAGLDWKTDRLSAAVDYILSYDRSGPPPAVEADRGAVRESRKDTSVNQANRSFESAPTGSGSDTVLQQILEELRIRRREGQHTQFSIGQLGGAIAQAFALCAIVWGLYAAVSGSDDSAIVRLLAGIAFQLVALTWFRSANAR